MGGWRGGMCVKVKPHGKWWFLEESCQELCGKKVEISCFVFSWFEEFCKEERCYDYCSVWKQDVSNPELIILIIAKKSCVPYSIMLTLSVLVTMWRKPLEAKTKVYFTSAFGIHEIFVNQHPAVWLRPWENSSVKHETEGVSFYNSSVWSHWTGQFGHFWGGKQTSSAMGAGGKGKGKTRSFLAITEDLGVEGS